MGASLESETTAATLGKEGVRTFNPMSNLDFLSITIGDYIQGHLQFIKGFKGPHVGVKGIQEILKKKEGPVTATVPKPKIGMTTKQHGDIAEGAWLGGIDCIKDDENLTSQSFNRFETRVEHLAKIRERVKKKTGDTKENSGPV